MVGFTEEKVFRVNSPTEIQNKNSISVTHIIKNLIPGGPTVSLGECNAESNLRVKKMHGDRNP